MNNLHVQFGNCYGIRALDKTFDFSNPQRKSYSIYAPNGLMKTSFTRSFDDLSKGEQPKEERYNRPSTCLVECDGNPISKQEIYVLKSEIDIKSDCSAITNILVNPTHKARYDELLTELDKLKTKLIGSLQKQSKIKKTEVERYILQDFNSNDFPASITEALSIELQNDLSPYEYAVIFDPKTNDILKSQEFITKAEEFNQRYQELFEQAGTIYKKGIFNPAKADTSFDTLDKQGFFISGHRVHLEGDAASIDKAELDQKIQAIHSKIDGDEELKKLRTNLAKNAQTQALADLIEKLSSAEVELLLERLKPDNQAQFRKELWAYVVQNSQDAKIYLDSFSASKDELKEIEEAAAELAPKWVDAVVLFNERFVDMPFTLKIANQVEAALGKEQAKLKFVFQDGTDTVSWSRDEIKTLSRGEERALYLLNLIFEVEARKLANQKTLFIIDDIADSFDYKNKHAIVQYLEDINDADNFYQIILTHNFDFFRTLANNFVHRSNCLMANRDNASITLTQAEGINNYFIKVWKNNVTANDRIMCATIPFTRNLLEYIKGEGDADYLTLTSMLHWKNTTDQITVGNYFDIYNRLFGSTYDINSTQSLKSLLFAEAIDICQSAVHNGLNLEDKILLSIAIRMQAEIFLTNELRTLKSDANYWCTSNSQFGKLMKEYIQLAPQSASIRILEKVSITVSSNIHLNSFMFEPILDLTIEHLISLYDEVRALNI